MAPGANELDTPRRLTAGALAGLTSVICTYPLDIVRTRLSVQSAAIGKQGGEHQTLPGIWETMTNIYRNEGKVFALYRGLGPTLMVSGKICMFCFRSGKHSVLTAIFPSGRGSVRRTELSGIRGASKTLYSGRRVITDYTDEIVLRSSSRIDCADDHVSVGRCAPTDAGDGHVDGRVQV